MHARLVTSTQNIALESKAMVAISRSHQSVRLLDGNSNCTTSDVIICRPGTRNVVLLQSPNQDGLFVNGNLILGGVCSIDSTAVCRLQEGERLFPFAVVFEDSVRNVPTGTVCDTCGKKMTSQGRSHCRRLLCVQCVDVFGGKCPICGRDLRETRESDKATELIQECLTST